MKSFNQIQDKIDTELFLESLDKKVDWQNTESSNPPDRYDYYIPVNGKEYGARFVRISTNGIYKLNFGLVPGSKIKRGKVMKGDMRTVLSAGVDILDSLGETTPGIKAVAISLPKSISRSLLKTLKLVLNRKLRKDWVAIEVDNTEAVSPKYDDQFLFFRRKNFPEQSILKLKVFKDALNGKSLDDITSKDLAEIEPLKPDVARFSTKKIHFSSIIDSEVEFTLDPTFSRFDNISTSSEKEDQKIDEKRKLLSSLEGEGDKLSKEAQMLTKEHDSLTTGVATSWKDIPGLLIRNFGDIRMELLDMNSTYSNVNSVIDLINLIASDKNFRLIFEQAIRPFWSIGVPASTVSKRVLFAKKISEMLKNGTLNKFLEDNKIAEKEEKSIEIRTRLFKLRNEIRYNSSKQSLLKKEINIQRIPEIEVPIEPLDWIQDDEALYSRTTTERYESIGINLFEWNEYISDLPKEDQQAIERYTSSGYKEINKIMRDLSRIEIESDYAARSAMHLFNVFGRSDIPKLKRPIHVYRSTYLDKRQVDDYLSHGYKYDPAFLSATVEKVKDSIFSAMGSISIDQPVGIISQIILPEGFNYGLPIRDYSQFNTEEEFLIGPGALFKILSSEFNPDKNRYHVRLIYIGNSYEERFRKFKAAAEKENKILESSNIMCYSDYIELTEDKMSNKKQLERLAKKFGENNFQSGEQAMERELFDFLESQKKANRNKK